MSGKLTTFDDSYVKGGSVDTNCDSLGYFPSINSFCHYSNVVWNRVFFST